MSTSDKIRAILALDGKKIADLAEYFGMTRQSMSNKMLRDSWSSEDLKKVAAYIGCDILFEMKNGQRIYLFSQADKDRFGPGIPKMDDAMQIDDNNYIDSKGNEFSRSEININEVLGGGFERAKIE